MAQEYDDVVEEPCLDKDEKKAVQNEMDDLHAHWADVNDGIKAKKERFDQWTINRFVCVGRCGFF